MLFRSFQQEVESGARIIVGVNGFVEESEERVELQKIDPASEARQVERTARVRAGRNAEAATAALVAVREAARSDTNLLPPMREALRALCSVGEVCGVLREEFGTYDGERG